MNTLGIDRTENFILACKGELRRCASASSEEMKRAILDTDTVQGLHWAIDFVKSIGHDVMTEAELRHAVRLTKFRGKVRPEFRG